MTPPTSNPPTEFEFEIEHEFDRRPMTQRLNDQTTQRPNDRAFTVVAPYYDRLMRDVPYRSWVAYLDQLLDFHGVAPRRILDLACGTGTVSEMLAAQGYDVVGVDLAEGMISEARRKAQQRGLPIAYFVQDMADLSIPGEPFDLVVSFFDSLNYVTDPAALDRAIRRVAEHIRPGGLFIFDVNSIFALENGFFDQENLGSNDRLRYVWRSSYDTAERLCRVDMRFFWPADDGVDREFRETHWQYGYEEEQLRDMLTRAGFDPIRTYHAYTFQPVRPTTDRIFFVATRTTNG